MTCTTSRAFCFACHRPTATCFCDDIPTIDNRTHLLVLQHRRERKHPFNTVRILERALQNIVVRVGYTDEFAGSQLPLSAETGLLYPSEDALPLEQVPAEARPRQLVMLDGTWHHAKTFLRDVPALTKIPKYRLTPDQPGRFRIRREPHPFSLSTLEAAIFALDALEPGLNDLDALSEVFEKMV